MCRRAILKAVLHHSRHCSTLAYWTHRGCRRWVVEETPAKVSSQKTPHDNQLTYLHRSPANSSPNTSSPTSTSPSSAASPKPTVAIPAQFPLGSYNMHTFLDTVQTNCTSQSSTWQCPPGIDYNTDHVRSLATFPFTITGSPGAYTIAPTAGSLAFNNITFSPTILSLVNAGQSSENYRFHIIMNKNVDTTISGTAVSCTFSATTFQGYLYTRMTSDYPAAGQQTPGGAQPWPYAVRFEQVVGGGDSTPSCVKAGTTDPFKGGLKAQDQGSLCSCLYKNWRTPAVQY